MRMENHVEGNPRAADLQRRRRRKKREMKLASTSSDDPADKLSDLEGAQKKRLQQRMRRRRKRLKKREAGAAGSTAQEETASEPARSTSESETLFEEEPMSGLDVPEARADMAARQEAEENQQTTKRFRWPALEVRPKSGEMVPPRKRAPTHEESLEFRLANVTEDYNRLAYRHRLCTHERVKSQHIVSERVSAIVENSVLSGTYCDFQVELDDVKINYLSSNDVQFHKMECARKEVDFISYRAKCNIVDVHVYVKAYIDQLMNVVTECRLLERNKNVPYIVRTLGVYYDWKEYDGKPVLVYHFGKDYKDVKPLSSVSITKYFCRRTWLGIAQSLASAVKGIHRNGYIHNAITTGNVYVAYSGIQYVGIISNFRMACACESAKPLTQRQLDLTDELAYFLAPELRHAGECPSKSSDVYAFGRTLHRMGLMYESSRFLIRVANKCTTDDPVERPSIDGICEELSKIRPELNYHYGN